MEYLEAEEIAPVDDSHAVNPQRGSRFSIEHYPSMVSASRKVNIFHSSCHFPVLTTDNEFLIEGFEEAFINLFEDVFRVVPVDNISFYFPLVRIALPVEDYLESIHELDATDREKALVLIALNIKGTAEIFPETDDFATVVSKVLKIVRTRIQLFNENGSTIDDVFSLLDPVFSQNGGGEVRGFMRFFAIDEKSFIKLETPEMRDFFKLLYKSWIFSNSGETVKVKDVDMKGYSLPIKVDEKDWVVFYLNKAPLHHIKLREAILDSSPRVMTRIIVSTPEFASEEDVVDMAKMMCGENYSKDKFLVCEEIYRAVLPKITEEFQYPTQLSKTHGFFINEVDEPLFILESMLEFFTKTDREFSFSEVTETGGNIINKNDGSKWFSDPNHRFYVTKKLVERFGVMDAMNKILEASSLNLELAIEQWMNYIENYDEFKNVPTSWLKELL